MGFAQLLRVRGEPVNSAALRAGKKNTITKQKHYH
jgi:hypothetical protein